MQHFYLLNQKRGSMDTFFHFLYLLGHTNLNCRTRQTIAVKLNNWIWFGFMVFNATFNNISVISWRSVLLYPHSQSGGYTGIPLSVPKPCVRNQSFVFCWILFIFGILVGHDLSMRMLCRFHGWLIFVRVIALFMFV